MQTLAQNGYTEGEVLAALQRRSGSSTLTFRYELLDQANRFVRHLDNVLSGSVSQDYLADIKRTARLTLRDTGTINYLSDRIKPWARIALPTTTRVVADEVFDVPGVLLWWIFDEPAGATTAEDIAGFGRDGAVGAGVTTGKPALVADGSAYAFSTANNATVSTTGDSFISGTALTIASWIRADSVGHNRGWISGKTPTGSTDTSFGARFAATGPISGATHCIRVWVTLDDGTVVAAETRPGTATTNTTGVIWSWQSGVGIRIWLDGQPAELAGTQNQTAVGELGDVEDFVVGHAPNAALGGWGGLVDEVVVCAAPIGDDIALRIHRSATRTGPYGDANWAEWPQGVFLLTSPSRAADQNGVVIRDVSAYDQLLVLNDDKVSDRFAVSSGVRYTDEIRSILAGAGITDRNITGSALTLPVTREWDPGTTKLRIVNDLLGAINYEGLFFDEAGVAVARPYVSPQDRASEHVYAADRRSVIVPGVEQTLDLFAVPNKWTLVVSDPDRVVLTASFTNNDPSSPTSTVSRGRTIVDFRTEQEAADLTTLTAKVFRLAFEASQVYDEVQFSTALMPVHSHADVYTLLYPDLGVSDKYSERGWQMPLKDGATMTHHIRRVVTV